MKIASMKDGFYKILSETFLILRTEKEIIKNVHLSSRKVRVIFVSFQ